MRLEARFNVRGGIYTTVIAEHRKKGWRGSMPADEPSPRQAPALSVRETPGPDRGQRAAGASARDQSADRRAEASDAGAGQASAGSRASMGWPPIRSPPDPRIAPGDRGLAGTALWHTAAGPGKAGAAVNGTREALFAFAQTVLDPTRDARVVCPNPFYQIYEGAALLAGATRLWGAGELGGRAARLRLLAC